MKLRFARHDMTADAISVHAADGADARHKSEWHHFTFTDDAQGLYGMVNLAVSGDVRSSERCRAAVSLIVYEREHGWSGTMNVYTREDVRFKSGEIDLAVGACAVRFVDGNYHVRARLKDDSVAIDATWAPQAEAVCIENMGGFINTFIVPRLATRGEIVIGGRRVVVEAAPGYHDHNWGTWDWSRDLGWNWGYLLDAPPADSALPATSIVFGQVTDATRSSARTELVLMVWRGGALTHVFLDDAVTLEVNGRSRVTAPRMPGVMALLNPGQAGRIPARLLVHARDGTDELEIECVVEHAVQLLIPHAAGRQYTAVSELVGNYHVRGRIDGAVIEYRCAGFAELAGAGQMAPLPRVGVGVS
jgi:hypothetical protein